jgi:outer membrane lipoprotein carrier protein
MTAGDFFRRGGSIVAAALFATCLFAQQRFPAAPALSAHELAQRVDRRYNQLHSLKAGFAESYDGLGIRRTESGTLLLLKPGRMKWEYSSPAGKLFLLDGKYAWFYGRGDSQVQRIPAKELDDLRSPLRFLLGHTELEKELSHLTLAPAGEGRFTLSGQPKGQEKRVSRLTLTVTADGVITGIEIEETDGALTRFTFTAEQPNAPVPAETFHFTPPPGVPVVDALPPALLVPERLDGVEIGGADGGNHAADQAGDDQDSGSDNHRCGRNDEANVRGFGILCQRAIEGDAPHHH